MSSFWQDDGHLDIHYTLHTDTLVLERLETVVQKKVWSLVSSLSQPPLRFIFPPGIEAFVLYLIKHPSDALHSPLSLWPFYYHKETPSMPEEALFSFSQMSLQGPFLSLPLFRICCDKDLYRVQILGPWLRPHRQSSLWCHLEKKAQALPSVPWIQKLYAMMPYTQNIRDLALYLAAEGLLSSDDASSHPYDCVMRALSHACPKTQCMLHVVHEKAHLWRICVPQDMRYPILEIHIHTRHQDIIASFIKVDKISILESHTRGARSGMKLKKIRKNVFQVLLDERSFYADLPLEDLGCWIVSEDVQSISVYQQGANNEPPSDFENVFRMDDISRKGD